MTKSSFTVPRDFKQAALPHVCQDGRDAGRPRHASDGEGPEHLCLTMIEAREIDGNGECASLLWRPLTTIEANDAAGAAEIVRLYRLYRLRWRIEEVFRSLKSEALRLKETRLQDARHLFKLALIGLAANSRTVQLVDARNGSDRPATDIIDPGLLTAADAIGPPLDGKTPRQKNFHPPRSLAWLAWIVARLGGWNSYYKSPGLKTMRA
ncbi:transposase (plasmid) [Acidithiobacillus ferrooxidans]|nr:transposase [Acidithiobacillus ferrooxidans]